MTVGGALSFATSIGSILDAESSDHADVGVRHIIKRIFNNLRLFIQLP
jgi:hypothetical protein